MQILVADDDPQYRDLLACLFEKWPEHHLTLVKDGLEAWALLDDPTLEFDAVFLDLKMPHWTGVDVLRQLNKSPLHQSVEIIICTASCEQDAIKEAIELGAKHFLFKPWTENTLADKLQQIQDARSTATGNDHSDGPV